MWTKVVIYRASSQPTWDGTELEVIERVGDVVTYDVVRMKAGDVVGSTRKQATMTEWQTIRAGLVRCEVDALV
jgi:hypothetical protein